MSVRVLMPAAALVLLAPAAVSAQQPALDPELTTPYLWRVVIHTPRPHPLLGPAFRAGLRRDLLAALQPALGPLGTVEVVDLADIPDGKRDPLWQAFAEKGFPALDTPRDLTGVKTHFLRVEVRDGAYHLETRQHDGFAGLPSPLVRKQSVRAPELVGRTAGLMIDRDFGPAGTIDPAPGNATEVTVRFRGGKLASLDRFVKDGDILAVSRISRAGNRAAPPPVRTATGKIVAPPPGSTPPAALTPAVHSFTLLRVKGPVNNKDGSAKCTVLRSPEYQNTLPTGGGVAGYRCLKLTTVQAPFAVRLVNTDGATASIPVASVRATEAGFGGPAESRDDLFFNDGLYRSRDDRPLANVACVTVSLGKTTTKHFPVPVLGPDPVTLPFALDPKAEAKAVFERAALSASARASDARTAQALCFAGVAKLIVAQKNADALARAVAGFEAADAADKVLSEEVQQLKGQAGGIQGAAEFLARVEQQLKSLRDANGQLAIRIKELEVVRSKENDPGRGKQEVLAQAVNTRISLLIARGEIDEALAAYDQLLTILPNQPEVKARRDKLAAEWKPKDPAHEKARNYLLKAWPALATVSDIKESLPQLRGAVDTLKKANDQHGLRGFLAVLGEFPARLLGLVRDLDPNADADRKTLADATAARDVTGKLEQEIVDVLKKGD